ncbi:hypothetical protein CAC42_303 [Sphaceloma murrayae]|uniref:Uncharacterized protein n=1 Tax=Sphaceloma murrayae TaxID=2082308 RepID=A0A2K1QZX4_9PEZI|nr:hypothetical protein CAC42_303 [Sphaceloma murrayae]
MKIGTLSGTLAAGLVWCSAAEANLETRQAFKCDSTNAGVKTINANFRDPKLFCSTWKRNDDGKVPIAGIKNALIDKTCACLVAKPTLAVSSMPATSYTSNKVQNLAQLQNTVAKPLPFCKWWVQKAGRPKTLPKMRAKALYTVCRAVIKDPSLLAASASTTATSVTTSEPADSSSISASSSAGRTSTSALASTTSTSSYSSSSTTITSRSTTTSTEDGAASSESTSTPETTGTSAQATTSQTTATSTQAMVSQMTTTSTQVTTSQTTTENPVQSKQASQDSLTQYLLNPDLDGSGSYPLGGPNTLSLQDWSFTPGVSYVTSSSGNYDYIELTASTKASTTIETVNVTQVMSTLEADKYYDFTFTYDYWCAAPPCYYAVCLDSAEKPCPDFHVTTGVDDDADFETENDRLDKVTSPSGSLSDFKWQVVGTGTEQTMKIKLWVPNQAKAGATKVNGGMRIGEINVKGPVEKDESGFTFR